MSKAVLISIRPKWCEKIINVDKTIEVRKTRPKLKTPFKCYIYCTAERAGYDALWVLDAPTREKYSFMAVSAYLENPKGANKGNGKVIGEFTCDRIVDAQWDYVPDAITQEVAGGNLEALEGTGMTDGELFGYVGDSLRGHCYGWHISDLRIYDAPRELSEFTGLRNTKFGAEPYDIKRPPQSWCYVEEMEDV